MRKKLTTEEFIEKARKVHGDKYDYSKVEYKNNKTEVCIICPEHGEFWQSPNSHLSGTGCSKCANEKISKKLKHTKEKFIEKARKVHGNKYEYSKVEYKGAKTKICIICPDHGEFWQTPDRHLHGQGCSKCAGTKKYTTEEFIENARKVHGGKYDYSKVKYINSSTDVCIICPVHGEFWQQPNGHLSGRGCPKCAGTKKPTTEEFIEKARNVHGNKYDYSKVEYKNTSTEVCIICHEHGEFWQQPNSHLHGAGCPECAGTKKHTTEEFIEKARKIHGDKYEYSKVEYKNNRTKVCIICPEHGEFWQTPNIHLRGNGCSECSGKKKPTTEEFIEKARNVHGNKYDYSKVEYKNTSTEVCIICPEHGEFWQSPNSHLSGSGCPKCTGTKKYTTEEFIEKAREIHGDKYDYSKVEYKNNKTEVCIICPEHGEFWQQPSSHLSGSGCPKCAGTKKPTTEEFIEKARNVHGNKYDYSKVEYKNTSTEVCIICPTHGKFWQKPYIHLHGSGCPKCNGGNSVRFFRNDKLFFLQEYDLVNMHSYVIMDLIGIDKLPKEFTKLRKFGPGTPERKKECDKLTEKYNSQTDEDSSDETETTSQDDTAIDNGNAADEIINNNESYDDTLAYNEKTVDISKDVFNEIKQVGMLINEHDIELFSTGDKYTHIFERAISNLWNLVLRDNESNSTRTIDSIRNQVLHPKTIFMEYIFTEFIKQYDEVVSMEIH